MIETIERYKAALEDIFSNAHGHTADDYQDQQLINYVNRKAIEAIEEPEKTLTK